MASPAYDGKGQPPAAQGWFSGLAAWWNALTPQYVTEASGGVSIKPHSGASSTAVSTGSLGAPAGASGKPADSSGAHAASGSDPSSAPSAAKP